MTRNITLNLDDEALLAARRLAARRGTSLSALLRTELLRLAAIDDAYEAARSHALAHLAHPFDLGGGDAPSRESLHDRAPLR